MSQSTTEQDELMGVLKDLSSVLSPDSVVAIPSGMSPLFQAFEVIGRASGLKFICPSKPPITIESICLESKVRYRRIVLRPFWWKKNQGYLLGFLKEKEGEEEVQEGKEGNPVVLYFQKERYLVINPKTRETAPLTAKNLPLLLPVAYMFYQSLPQNISGFRDVARFCLQGTLKDYFSLSLSGALAVLVGFLFPLANKVFFDYVIPHLNLHLYMEMMLAISVAAVSSAIFLLCRSFFVLKLSGVLEHRMQMGLWDRLFQLPIHFFRKLGLGDLINRTLVTEQFRRNLSENTLLILFNGTFSVIYLVMMLIYSWQLSFIGCGIAVLALSLSVFLSFIKLTYDRALLASNAELNTFLTQVVNGICKIRMAAAESRIFSNWARGYRDNQALTLKARNYQLAIRISNQFFSVLATFLIYAFVIAWMYFEKTDSIFKLTPVITVGTFLAFTASLSPFLQAMIDIGNNFSALLSFVPFWERARPLFLTPVESGQEKASPEEFTGSCYMENVSFRYHENTPLVLDGVSIRIPAKSFIGIVGPSGSGKSTLLQLLVGFETPSKGVISFDHYDMNHLNLRTLRKSMGIVSQSSNIFFGTIFDNIVCGGSYSPEQIWEAITLSMLKDELLELPMGLYTILPGGGITLSGGQSKNCCLRVR